MTKALVLVILLPTGSEERGVLEVGNIHIAILPLVTI